jgi:hypothetical protein
VTPASRIGIRAIGQNRHLLGGIGLDWGSGTGCLAIAAARVDTVRHIFGLDISHCNVEAARNNARLNDVTDRVTFIESNSYVPVGEVDVRLLKNLRGQTNFILANPPSSDGDDGFAFRRVVLDGARSLLVQNGMVLLNISFQYGVGRVARLCQEITGFQHLGILASTEWVPFDLQRPDLRRCLEDYCEEESRGGLTYSFGDPDRPGRTLDAHQARELHLQSGGNPLTRWQTHLFRYVGDVSHQA